MGRNPCVSRAIVVRQAVEDWIGYSVTRIDEVGEGPGLDCSNGQMQDLNLDVLPSTFDLQENDAAYTLAAPCELALGMLDSHTIPPFGVGLWCQYPWWKSPGVMEAFAVC